MKRILLLLALALLLAACGAPEAPEAPEAPSAPDAPAAPEAPDAPEAPETSDASGDNAMAAPDFTLSDQYGERHTLSDYRGKVVFLNFWATWCGPCQNEMPDIEALYQQHGQNTGDVVFLGISMPVNDENPQAGDVSPEEVAAFMEENGYTYPTLMDLTGEWFRTYGISAYPTTYIIDGAGNVAGGTVGMISKDDMETLLASATA